MMPITIFSGNFSMGAIVPGAMFRGDAVQATRHSISEATS